MKTCIKCRDEISEEDLECLDEDDVKVCDRCRERQYEEVVVPTNERR